MKQFLKKWLFISIYPQICITNVYILFLITFLVSKSDKLFLYVFIKNILTNSKRDLDHSSLPLKCIVNKVIFVIIKKFNTFKKPWERGGIGRRTALKMRHLRVCRFKSDRSHFDEYI